MEQPLSYFQCCNAPDNLNRQSLTTPPPLLQADLEDSDIWKFLLSKSPPSFASFVSESPLFPTPGGGNFFILNVRTATGSEHNCHNLLGGMSESYQNPLGCPCPMGIHTDWCITQSSLGYTPGPLLLFLCLTSSHLRLTLSAPYSLTRYPLKIYHQRAWQTGWAFPHQVAP